MKKVTHKITAFLMAIVVLFSTMSFTIDMHYCGDYLVDTAVFSKADSCGMEMASSTNPDCSTVKKDCCSEDQINFDGQNELQNSTDTITLEQQQFIASFVNSYIQLFEETTEDNASFYFTPPLIVKDIHKFHEVYLI